MKFWRHYHYKNLTYLSVSIIIAIFLLQNKDFQTMLHGLGEWGYVGALLGGMFFSSTFTVSIGSVILFVLANNHLSSIEIAIFGAIGSVLCDFIIFQAIRSHGLIDEIKHVFEFMGGEKLHHLLNTKYFTWTLPVAGAIIIASPLPDEVGVSLMGISHMRPSRFLLLSFGLNFTGILIIITAARII